MADVENQQESSFPVKRKSDLCCQEEDHVPSKAQKLDPSSNSKDGEVNGSGVENLAAEEKKEGGDGEDEDEEEEEEEEVDRKGKGISREDKGKGKMIEVEESDESDDDDDEDDEDGDEYDESDLSDDPLAEVDLDNILPSRTRRRSIQPGVFISNDRGGVNEDDDDDSSDDSDA
ncbi:histone H2A.Z-specific chaperone CHZ1 [Brassica rapa]|uniref:Histone chaperone domain-containing protein n=1 Tax=Brassica campestris TaxID=3711 RepID=M4DJS5_BRACM|nr:histone H2A.Z-specific chaperone CHZ1 [Brassica rapa]